MAQALSQLLFGMFDTQNYFVKLGFCLFSGKIWETRSGEIYIDGQANNTMCSTGTETVFCGIFIGEIYSMKLEKYIDFFFSFL